MAEEQSHTTAEELKVFAGRCPPRPRPTWADDDNEYVFQPTPLKSDEATQVEVDLAHV